MAFAGAAPKPRQKRDDMFAKAGVFGPLQIRKPLAGRLEILRRHQSGSARRGHKTSREKSKRNNKASCDDVKFKRSHAASPISAAQDKASASQALNLTAIPPSL